ncbi:hypothetical protein N9K06_01865, partial [Omnitrophica bacterium]|nr:hypothetical protein [Candidatus Omnitrophota bacterium]
MKKNYLSLVAKLTLSAFLTTQVIGPVPAQAAVQSLSVGIQSETPRLPFDLNIPAELGTIDQLSSGAGPAIVHIQDAHGNFEAQKNIRAILNYLHHEYGFDLVLLEGAQSKLKPELLRFFPQRMDLTLQIAEALTRDAIVKGPELF